MTSRTIVPAERPAPTAPRPYRFPEFEQRELPNGLRVVIAPVVKLPLATVLVLVDAGAVCESPGKDGVAQLAAKLLLEGTERSDGAELAERFERLGASVESHADWDVAVVSLTVLTHNLHPAFRLLTEVLQRPSFRQRELDRLKAERLAALLQLRTEPRGLADELFARFSYDPASRYSRPDGGDEQSVAAIKRNDIVDFYATRFVPGAMTVIITGDVQPDIGAALVADTLGRLPRDSVEPGTTTSRPARASRAVHIVAKPDAPQSELRMGHVGLPRNHPDYFATVVMNAVLGGLFSSRINLNLREAHAYTYGAFSAFEWRRQAGPFAVATAVQSKVTDAAAREVLKEIDRMRAEPISADELSLATSYLDGVFPIRYETTSAIARALANLIVYSLPADFYDSYRPRIRGVSRDDVMASAQKHLHPESLQIVVVGDAGAIRQPMEQLGFGPVMLYDTQGRPANF